MNAPRHPIWSLLDRVQMDVRELEERSRKLAARIVELRAFVSQLPLAPGGRETGGLCPECGLGGGRHLEVCSSAPPAGPDLAADAMAEARRLNVEQAARLAGKRE